MFDSLRHYAFDLTDDADMLTHCAPIFIFPDASPMPDNIYANGTVSLIDTGTRKLLVTCDHVWSEFLSVRAEHSDAWLAVTFRTGSRFPIRILDASIIDRDEKLDLAVFEANFSDDDLGFKEFYRVHRFPIPDPRPRQPISFVGFPGEARRAVENVGLFAYCSFGITVSDISESMILLANSDPRVLRDNSGNPISPIAIVGWLGEVMTKREAMGLGDVTLMAFVGAALGPTRALITVFLGATLGAITFAGVVIPVALLRRGHAREQTELALGSPPFETPLVPFGVFLAPAALLTLFWGDALLGWITRA